MFTLLTPYLHLIKIGLGVLAIISIGVLYFNWKESVRREAILEFANKQQEEIIKSKDRENELFKKQIEVMNKLQIEKEKVIQELEKSLDNAQETVYSNNKGDEGEAPKILKDAIDEITKLRNSK